MPGVIVWPVDAVNPDSAVLAKAAARIRAGELVAFPTETVYGLGANALSEAAVARIFAVKGRPATNPVIVHVADETQARSLTQNWTDLTARLATAFWPGPLTLVLEKNDTVPGIVTAEGSTVALRCPSHPVALALLRASGVPIAAPSANRSTQLSPTRAEHVNLGDEVVVLDGGPCVNGIESTVVDATGDVPRILRPGPIDAEMLAAAVGPVALGGDAARSPGQMEAHYRPSIPLHLAENAEQAQEIVNALRRRGLKAQYLAELTGLSPAAFARVFYETLHREQNHWNCVVIVKPPVTLAWSAIHDRLRKAATPTPTDTV